MFEKSLEQENIFEEIKNGTGNLLINAKAGTGKCLGINTLVVFKTGVRKKVQNIKVGDLLMGDDGTPRTVLSTTSGFDTLYKVSIKDTNEFFICNGDHILTCKTGNGSIKKIIDISINDILKDNNIINNLYLYRYIWNIKNKKHTKDTNYGTTFFDNEYNIKYITVSLDRRYKIISDIINTYTFPTINGFKFRIDIRKNVNFEIFKTLLRGCGFEYNENKNIIYGDFSLLDIKIKDYDDYNILKSKVVDNTLLSFKIELYRKRGKYYGFTLDGNGRFLINDYIVTHNTTTIVKSLDLINDDKNIILLAFNRHIANELKERVPNKKNIRISTTHALGWGAIRRKYKEAVIDEDKVFNVIRRKINRWNLEDVDNIDQYIMKIKKMVDLCRVTITTRRQFISTLAQKHGIEMTDEDCRRVLSVMEDMLNDTKTFDFIDMIYIPAIDNKVWLFPNDYVFVDECVDGRCNIITRNNKLIKIIDLYEKHRDDDRNLINADQLPEVLSYNVETKKNEYKKITNIMYKGNKDVTMIKIEGTYLFATSSHLFYTMEGWREVNDLNVGDVILSNEYNRFNNCYYPNEEQIDFLYSYLICYYLNERQANIHKFRIYIKDYDESKISLIDRVTPIYVKSNKPDINMIEYSTVRFYLNDKLFTKEYVIKNMTIKQLSLVYILSAKYFKNEDKYGFFVSVKTFDEMVYAKHLFEERFNQTFDIVKTIKSYCLIPRNQDWFFTTICEYVPIEFKRDIPYKYWNSIKDYRYQKNTEQQYCGIIGLIQKDKRKVNVYDISVKDNNNFYMTSVDSKSFREKTKEEGFAGFLVHNCQDYNKAQQFMLNKIVKKDTGRLISVGDFYQSIYSFNGSDNNSFNWFREKENTVELPLSTSYRCPKRVIELAQTIVPSIRYKESAEDGEVTQGSVLELAQPGDYVLARKNKPLVVLLFDLLRQNKMATIRGNDIGKKLAETVNKYKTVTDLNTGLTEKLNEMRDYLVNNMGVIDFRNDQRYISLEDNVDIIRFLINNTNSIERIIEKLSLIFTDNPTGIILSTIHKSKGLEADTVFIIRPDEIRLKTPLPEAALQEANLEYIAYTRSKNKLIFDHDWTDERD
jgi:hypothetical protein